MSRRIISLLLFLFLVSLSYGQDVKSVYLKNGSIIKGNVLNVKPGESVTVNDAAGNVWVFPMDEVDRIESTDILLTGTGFTPGLKNTTSLGFLVGSQNSQYLAPFSIQNSIGFLLPNGLYSGLSAGLEFVNIVHVPVMIDFNYLLLTGEVAPYLAIKGGYAIPGKFRDEVYSTAVSYNGGPVGAVGIGLKIRSKDIMAWDVSVLYRYMKLSYFEDYENTDNDYTYTDVYNRLEIRLGFYIGR